MPFFEVQVKLQNEINLRKKAESLAAAAQEKATLLEGQLPCLSETADGEKKLLHNKLSQLKKDFELSISQKSADVRILIWISSPIIEKRTN